jgi:hypothetical protein
LIADADASDVGSQFADTIKIKLNFIRCGRLGKERSACRRRLRPRLGVVFWEEVVRRDARVIRKSSRVGLPMARDKRPPRERQKCQR